MTSKLVVNTIEADTGISSVSFASSISLSSTSVFHFGDAGLNIGADTNIYRPAAGELGFRINGSEKVRIDSNGRLMVGTTTEGHGNADEFTISFINNGVSGGDQGRCGMTIRSGDNTSGVTQNGYIYFSNGTSGSNHYKGVVAYNHANNYLYFWTNGDSEKLRIASDGSLTSTANNNGQIIHTFKNTNTTASSSAMTVEQHFNFNRTGGGMDFSAARIVAGKEREWIGSPPNQDGFLAFYTALNESATEKLRITSDGSMVQTSTGSFQIAKGTTGERPTGAAGMLRFNTTLSQTEEYRDGNWYSLSNKTSVTGGTVTTSGNYTIHTFTSSGTLLVSGSAKSGIEYLIVAGGGGGGGTRAGGGGAGGMLTATGVTLQPGVHQITVGSGGAAGTGVNSGGQGGNSSIGSVATSIGGGYGGGQQIQGGSGGSGGGGSDSLSGGAGTSGQGNNGGGSTGSTGGGGGGGKGGVGNQAPGTSDVGGAGGAAGASAISGSTVNYSGGGGGGSRDNAAGGNGGGGGAGKGGRTTGDYATAGSANQGGGGGGGGRHSGADSASYNGAAGGSGIVIIRYLT